MIIVKPNVYACDFCETKIEASNMPESFAKVTLIARRGGFEYVENKDMCQKCAPNVLFHDPPQKKINFEPNIWKKAALLFTRPGRKSDY